MIKRACIFIVLLVCTVSLAVEFILGGGFTIANAFPDASVLGLKLGWANFDDDVFAFDIAYRPGVTITPGSSPVSLTLFSLQIQLDVLGRDSPFVGGFYLTFDRTNVPISSIATTTTWRSSTRLGIVLGGRYENVEGLLTLAYPVFEEITSFNVFDYLGLELKMYFESETHKFKDRFLAGVQFNKYWFRFYLEFLEPI